MESAFLDLRGSGWAQQYLPDLVEGEAEVFGNRTISGFLAQVGAEEASASDQIIWSEQGQLHLDASGEIDADGGDTGDDAITGAGRVTTPAAHGIRVGDTVILNVKVGTTVNAGVLKCYVARVPSSVTYDVVPYTQEKMDSELNQVNISF